MSTTRSYRRHVSMFSKTAPKLGLTFLPIIAEVTETVSGDIQKTNTMTPAPANGRGVLSPRQSLHSQHLLPTIFKERSVEISPADEPYEAIIAALKIAIRSLNILSAHLKSNARIQIMSLMRNRRTSEILTLQNIKAFTEILDKPLSSKEKLNQLIEHAKQYFQAYPVTARDLEAQANVFSAPVKMHQVCKIISTLDINHINSNTLQTLQQDLAKTSRFFVNELTYDASPRVFGKIV